ncbi:succinylglutamate desuccinylase/aspartoacylase family protein [Candidatus Saccharibacteria bacterium]|nr:succinylglutamate desuccinylase/aspartoacylase family protein [Candidatus Saccharibacteria bacterium]
MPNNITSEIIEIDSGKTGPALAIFAGVHGNELAGVYALQKLLPTLKLTRGKLYIAFANPPAIRAKVRMVKQNLNRCFVANNKGTSYEDRRARELMAILDKCDALLDLHMFYDDDGLPFVICEDNAVEVAHTFDVGIISTNWAKAEPGASDGYMFSQGKIGLCVECGPISKSKEYTDFAVKTIYQFLQYFDMSLKKVSLSKVPKRFVVANKSVYKSSANFTLKAGYKNFDRLKPGEVIAQDGGKKYLSQEGECIIFPHYKARVGEEAYIIGIETIASPKLKG